MCHNKHSLPQCDCTVCPASGPHPDGSVGPCGEPTRPALSEEPPQPSTVARTRASLHPFSWPSNIPLHTRGTFRLSIHPSIDTGRRHFLTIVSRAAANIRVHVCVQAPASSAFGYIPTSGIAASYSNSMCYLMRLPGGSQACRPNSSGGRGEEYVFATVFPLHCSMKNNFLIWLGTPSRMQFQAATPAPSYCPYQ